MMAKANAKTNSANPLIRRHDGVVDSQVKVRMVTIVLVLKVFVTRNRM